MLYCLIFILVLITSLTKKDIKTKKASDNIQYWCICVLLSTIIGLRYRVGGDTLWYHDNFNTIMPNLKELNKFNFATAYFYPGWYYLNAIAKSINNHFYTVQLIQSFLINIIIFQTFKKYSNHKYTCVAIYLVYSFFYFNTEIMRESISVCFFIISINYFLEKRWLIYLFYALVALSFHPSAYIAFFFPIIYKYLPNNCKSFITYFIILFMIFGIANIQIIVNIFPTDFLKHKAGYYMYRDISLNRSLEMLLKYALPSGLLLLTSYKYKIKKENIKQELIRKCTLIYFYIAIISSLIDGTYRILNYFVVFYIIFLSDNIFKIHHIVSLKYKSLVIISLIIIFNFQIYYYFIQKIPNTGKNIYHYYQRWEPYNSVFNPQKNNKREWIYYKSMEATKSGYE